MSTLTIGEQAPNFALPDQDGVIHSLSQYNGQWILLYFYPKDDTPGCTKEACSIRDRFSELENLNIQVFGMSADLPKSHKKFSEKYTLPFTLLSDETKETLKKYGVWGTKKFMGKEYEGIFRTSFLIDPSGMIVNIYENVKPEIHVEEILNDFKSFQK